MSFASPWFLLAGLLVVPLLWLAGRSRAPLPRAQLWLVAGLQAAAWLLAVVALAGPWSTGAGSVHRVAVWAAADDATASADVRAWRVATRRSDPFHVVLAGASPRCGEPGWAGTAIPSGTPDLAAALRAAAALVPAGAAGQVALFTDGRHDGAPVAELAAELSRRGLRLSVRALPRADAPAALLSLAHVPCVAAGEAFRVVAEVRTTAAGPARLEIRHGDELLAVADVALRPGTHRHPLDVVLRAPGLAVLDASLQVGGRVDAAPGRERSAVLVDAPLTVLHLTPEASRRAALTATLAPHGIVPVAPDPAQPLAADVLARCAAVLVDELPAEAWPAASQVAVATAVSTRGLGLLLAGTHANLGPGGYGSSPLLPILPVRMPQREERRDPSIALVVILDTSGSMGGGRIELAKEVARLAIKSLQPHDKVGIVEFYGSKRWAAPLQPATNTIEITRALNRLQAGGGTIIYSALEEAHFALLNARTRFQHILVLTDGGVESGPFEALARRMASAGQTLSTVLIGPQANSPFLMSLAQWGRGRFYACPDRFQLPELMFREPQSALLPAVQEKSLAVARSAQAEAVAAFGSDELPMTGGIVEASVRRGAEVLLRAGGAPYLVGWDQGQGRALVLAGQALGPQAGALRDDAAYGAFLADVLRSASSGGRALRPALALRAQERGLHATLSVPDALPLPRDARLTVADASVSLVPAGGRRLSAFVPWPAAAAAGPVRVEVRDASGLVAAGGACPPLPRAARADDAAADLARVAAATGGDVRPPDARGSLPVSADPAGATRGPQVVDWRGTCVAAALVAFVLALLLRRLPLDRARAPAAALAVAFALVAGTGPLLAQEPTGDDAAIATAIAGELRARGDLDALAQRWRDASPRHRYALALARGDLAAAVPLCPDPVVRARLLAIRGQAREALAASAALSAIPGATAVERGEWLMEQALLRHATGDAEGAARDVRVAVEAVALPAFTERAGRLAGALGLWALALAWSRPASDGKLLPGGGKAAFHAALARGLWQQRAGDLAAAGREYQAALGCAELQRDRAYALSQIVAVHRAGGTLAALAGAWQERARGKGTALSAEELRAMVEVLRELGRPREARATIEALPAAARQPFAALAVDLALEAGEAETAVAQLRVLLDARPDDAELRSHLALLLVDLHREAEAATLLLARGAAATRKELRNLCTTAIELGLDDVVQRLAAAIAAGGEPGDATDAAMLEVAHLRRRQRSTAAVARLRAAQGTASRPADRVRVAEQLESLGQGAVAAEILGELFAATGAEDLGMRLAWMLSESKQDADRARAIAIFRRVWLSAGSPARRVQAEDHVLDLAAREGTLADLAIELEGQLADPGTANRPAVREALVKIHARARDTVGAAAILRQWVREEPAQEVTALEQLARIHLAADEYRAYDRVLRQLIARNPEGEIDYRQQLAVAALERGRPAEARQCIHELLDRPGEPDLQALEFAAGIYTLAAQHEDAVRLYRRTLALHPERVETWLLLGNALRAAGRRELAIGLFQSLLLQQPADDLFVVAVDGLLNMEADKDTLGAAARAVRLRLAARPEQVFLHRLLQDLLESLGRPAERLTALADTVVVAGEQRTSFVRELLQEADTRRDAREYVSLGRTLLLLGDEVPPAVFLSLGEALLRSGDLDAATRAFARARLADDFASVEDRIAELYERAGRLAEAERVRRQILRRAPDEPAALLACARVCEQLGADERTRPLYQHAARLLLPADLAAPRGAARGGVLPVARNRDDSGPQFATAWSGALRTSAGADGAAPLLAMIEAAFDATPRPTPEQELRLVQLLRHLTLAAGDPALAARTAAREDALLRARPGDEKLRKEIVGQRLDAGELDGALRVATSARGGETTWDLLRVQFLRGEEAGLQAAAAKAPVELMPDLARLWLLAGRRADAEAVAARVAELAQREPEAAGAALVRVRRLLGLPVDDAALAQRQLDKALAGDQPLARRVPAVLAALKAARHLPASERQSQLATLAVPVIQARDATLASRLLDEGAEFLPTEQIAGLAELVMGDSKRPFMIATQVRHLRRLDAERTQQLLDDALRRLTGEERRTQTLRILQTEGRNLPEPVALSLVRSLDLSRLGLADRYPLQTIVARGTVAPAVMALLTERLAVADRDEPTALLAAVRVAPAAERARAVERAVLALAARDAEPAAATVVDELVEMVEPAAVDALLARLPDRTPAQLRAALERRAGRPAAAAACLAAAFERRPDDMSLLYQATRWLEQDDQWQKALELYRLARAQSGKFYAHQAQQLARLELRAGRPQAALEALQAADDPLLTNYGTWLRVLAAIPDATVRGPALRGLVQGRAQRGRSIVSLAPGRTTSSDQLATALARPVLAAPSLDASPDATPETDNDLLVLVPEGEAIAAALRRQMDGTARRDDLSLDRVVLGRARLSGKAEAAVAAAVATLEHEPHDPQAQHTVLAAAQLGLAVPAAALRGAILHRASTQPIDAPALVDLAVAAQRAGDAEMAQRLLGLVLGDRNVLRNVRLRGFLAGALALAPAEQVLRLAPAAASDVDDALDSELLAALIAGDVDPAAIVGAWRPAMTAWLDRDRERERVTGQALQLVWSGALLAAGERDAALAVLCAEPAQRVVLSLALPSLHLLGAALPPLQRWKDPAAAAAVGAALVEATRAGGEERRGLFARLGGVLAARLQAAGQAEAAADLRARVRAAATGAAVPLDKWLAEPAR